MTIHPRLFLLDYVRLGIPFLWWRSRCGATALMAFLWLMAASSPAAIITVDTTNGGPVSIDGNCSLSEALVGANFNVAVDGCASGASGQDTIAFDSSIFSGSPLFLATITLEQSLDISDGGVVIEPPDGRNLWVQGAGSNRLFTISAGNTLIRDTSLIGGDSTGNGGAILINAPSENSSLQLEDVVGSNSLAEGYGGFIGGEIGDGIFNLNIISSSFTGNRSGGSPSIGGGVIGLDVATSAAFLNVLIQGSSFSGNSTNAGSVVAPGGAISLITDATSDSSFGLIVENSVFSDNSAPGSSGGALHIDNIRSQNGYAVTVRNSRFSGNSASRAGAVRAVHSPVTATAIDQLLLEQNSFLENSSSFNAGAVEIQYVSTIIRNNIFALNTSSGTATGNPGALRIDHDGTNNATLSNGDADIRANTFFENEGNPREVRLDMPLIGMGASASSVFSANVVQANSETSTACVINNGPNGNYGSSNVSDPLGACRIGPDSVFDPSLNLQWTAVVHPVHTMAAIPDSTSSVVDLWPELVCLSETPGGVPLATDLLGERRDSGTGLPPDGDGDGDSHCDAGSVEIDGAPGASTLTVNLAGSGTGTVQSDIAGIDCPGTCTASFSNGTVVDLEAVGQSGSAFTGWSGDCSGTGVCTVTMDQAREVTATFTQGTDLIFSDRFIDSP